MTGQVRIKTRIILLAGFAGLVAACGGSKPAPPANPPAATAPAPARGGELVAAVRTEPQSFNRLQATDAATDLVTLLTQGKLVRVNKATQAVEPWLAESWTASPDGRTITLKLRPNVKFSDGQPFTADDVVFTFAAAYDKKADGALKGALEIGGKPLTVTAPDPLTVVLTFPTTSGLGVALLDILPIYPRHKLEAALKGGTFDKAWGLSTPVADLAGLGPFVLSEYKPGQRLVFTRNPNYWRKAADGTALPYLDRLVVDVIPDDTAALLRLDAGQIDLSNPIPADSYATVKRAADAGRLKLVNLGTALEADSLWFNLKPGAVPASRAWLQKDELRRAISLAVDRKLFADTVFLGAADPVFGPITTANKKWFWNGGTVAHDPAAAKALLATIGLADKNGDGMLEDAAGQPARFTLITQTGRPRFERAVAVIRDELKKIGLDVQVAAIDGNAVVAAIMATKKFDAVYFNPTFSNTDPAANLDFWLSSGVQHFWNASQPKPATAWEAEVDALIAKQAASIDDAERKRLFDDVQRIFAEHAPIVYFAAPRVYVATTPRVLNATPAVNLFPLLWSPDTLAVAK